MAEVVRAVPGAPPPKEISKTARKKRKAKPKADDASPDVLETSTAALIETAPTSSDVLDGAVAPELVVQPVVEATTEEAVLKPSPIVDLIHKRLKATSKKIGRISTYAATGVDKLNDDQKATLKTLPALEAVQKELTEVKKAVETHEAQLATELAQTRQELERNEKERVAAAVAEAEGGILSKVSNLLNFLRLRPLLASGEAPFGLENAEVNAVFSAAEVLLAEQSETKDALVSGLLLGKGSYEGIPYTRFWEITHLCLNSAPTPQEAAAEPVEESVGSAAAQPLGLSTTGSFDFMQASELEPGFEENAEWVERPDVAPQNGHMTEDAAAGADETSNAAIDWADDEGGLPPIAGLHAKFGTSGTATPVVADELQTNGHTAAVEEDDGFTTARGRAGRAGRARAGGFRGVRGGFRGGDRGRGGFRGRGDGERGRGGGRGRARGDRGGPPPPA